MQLSGVRGLSKLAGSDQTLPVFFMRLISLSTLALAMVFATSAALCMDSGHKPKRHYPKATPPPPPSPIYTESKEPVPDEKEIAQMAAGHYARLESELESAVLSRDRDRREAAFVFILPELVQQEALRVAGMLDRLPKGEPRDLLRKELTRNWVSQDSASAVRWMKSLPEHERRASAVTAVEELFAQNPAMAADVAKELGMANLVREKPRGDRD
jgi:hypothetical protein